MAASQKTVTVNEKEYTLQNPGAMWYLETMDNNTNARGNLQRAGYAKDLLENVVVDPVTKVEHFDEDFKSLNELVGEIETFLNA